MADPLFLLDSNICIYVLTGGPETVRRRVQNQEPGDLVTSAIAFAEVMTGIRSPEEIANAEAFFAVVEVLPFDKVAARTYATMPFRRARFDRLIAAHALSLDLTLVTANVRDFADVPGLRVENWVAPA